MDFMQNFDDLYLKCLLVLYQITRAVSSSSLYHTEYCGRDAKYSSVGTDIQFERAKFPFEE